MGLYQEKFEKDNCGFGLIAQMDNQVSHWLVETAIYALTRLTHRGAISADGKTGDGCGLLLSKPDLFFQKIATELEFQLAKQYAVGMIFLSSDNTQANTARRCLEQELMRQGLTPLGWRVVPVDELACGHEALKSKPQIEQIFVNAPDSFDQTTFDRHLYIARRCTEKCIEANDKQFYVASLSSKVISYKGLVMPDYLTTFYPDLNNSQVAASLAVFHQRFATNTFPQWRLAQPFRLLAHNGEINTIQGNRNWAKARSYTFASKLIPNMEDIRPWVAMEGSDSYSLDNMVDGLVAGGMDIFKVMRLLIPPAWQNLHSMDPDLKAFYEYSSMHMEPWDGPAGVVLTDGRYAACALDRNGLRPARYVITKDRHITLASEVGVYDYQPEDVISKGRLKPGQMLAVDTATGKLLLPEDIDQQLKSKHPYKQWMREHSRKLKSSLETGQLTLAPITSQQLKVYDKLFQLSLEEKDQIIKVLAEAGQEAIGSMGDDTPIPVLSTKIRSLYDYFRQQFAQVTNPPIDPLRECIVMSLETCLGSEKNLFEESPQHADRLLMESPVLSADKFKALQDINEADYQWQHIDLNLTLETDLKQGIESICQQAEEAINAGKVILILSDRHIAKDKLPVHALLATGAVHHHLVDKGLRCQANIIVETATARDPHHFAVLIGYGATAVYPYLAYETLQSMLDSGEITDKDSQTLAKAYRKGIRKGLYKILSKMGISTITSYRGAQLFEIVGLDNEVAELCFKGTTNRLQGAKFAQLEQDQRSLLKLAWNPRKSTHQGGLLKYVHGEEYHAYHPDVVKALQTAVATNRQADYQRFADLVNQRPIANLRDLLGFKNNITPVDLEKVEPIEDILKRFDSAAMSLGALSPEAHETLAEAMNRLGGRSNSGEGGEDPKRYNTLKSSKIKQVASGRFGVTPHYLSNAEVLQIKVAQGAKPGEGGQLPGGKVNQMIATLRFSKPGVALISPPPHHDIYSIEDLAQLIFDLKQVNPSALVSVKLVAEAGVGTIAAGVAKAYADLITIAGHDGGTGASPLTSVKYAGSPWEIGLAETHQTLCANNLRSRVRLQTDGGLKTGLDVVKAAMLGAESFGFGTAPMIAMGCKYLRICHLNNCATGIATQDERLRLKHFKGEVQQVMNYFTFVAEEVRQWMAKLGVRTINELIGRTDLLEILPANTEKQSGLDLSPMLQPCAEQVNTQQYCVEARNPPFDKAALAQQMLADMQQSIIDKTGGEFSYPIKNTNRSIGARISGEIAKHHGNQGMAEQAIKVYCQGTAGQSFGVWNAGGLHLHLEGDANDYVGKGMAGGQIVLHPPMNSRYRSYETTIMGNTCLYGATGGKLFAAGLAGERFCVRNSGAIAVVEGIGDHGCEYMTGGVVVVLGPTGVNFGAGMTGGFAFVLDKEQKFVDCYNNELIDIHRLLPENMEVYRHYLENLIQAFVVETKSCWGQHILQNFEDFIGQFWLVKPKAADLYSLLDALRQAA